MELIHENITNKSEERKIVKISAEAHDALKVLMQFEQEENNGFGSSFVELASSAIIETAKRKQSAKARRLARLAELSRANRTQRKAGALAA